MLLPQWKGAASIGMTIDVIATCETRCKTSFEILCSSCSQAKTFDSTHGKCSGDVQQGRGKGAILFSHARVHLSYLHPLPMQIMSGRGRIFLRLHNSLAPYTSDSLQGVFRDAQASLDVCVSEEQ